MKTQVAIIGAGPSGLILARALALQGIDSIVIENKSREYVEGRIRAGLLETQAVELLDEIGVGERLHREGLEHRGIYLQWPGERHHIDMRALVGQTVWVYGQVEIQKDLDRACDEAGQVILYSVSDVRLEGIETDSPRVYFNDAQGVPQRIDCAIIAGCDGFHGVSRPSIPDVEQGCFERVYPYSWLGILANVAPSTDELIYAWHPDGFAMHSMRSPSVSRLYLQVDPHDDIANWSDDRIWDTLDTRLALPGWSLQHGEITEKSILPMRSFVSSTMRHGRLFLAGDAAHIVPPTGAKGLNSAASDIRYLVDAITAWLGRGNASLADSYSQRALQRIWRSTHFSWWMTSMLHTSGDPFDAALQLSQLRHVVSSPHAQANLAENYCGLPLDR